MRKRTPTGFHFADLPMFRIADIVTSKHDADYENNALIVRHYTVNIDAIRINHDLTSEYYSGVWRSHKRVADVPGKFDLLVWLENRNLECPTFDE